MMHERNVWLTVIFERFEWVVNFRNLSYLYNIRVHKDSRFQKGKHARSQSGIFLSVYEYINYLCKWVCMYANWNINYHCCIILIENSKSRHYCFFVFQHKKMSPHKSITDHLHYVYTHAFMYIYTINKQTCIYHMPACLSRPWFAKACVFFIDLDSTIICMYTCTPYVADHCMCAAINNSSISIHLAS